MHAAAIARAPNVERFAGWTDSPTLATHRPEESPGLGRWGGASLAAATVALALCRIATPVATCGTDAHDFDESGLPAGWDQDMDSIRDHLEASMGIGEAQYYADSDMPSDVEFTGVFEQHHAPRKEDLSPHHAIKSLHAIVEDLVQGEKELREKIHSWRPTGFPFHHFPTGKGTVDVLSKKRTH